MDTAIQEKPRRDHHGDEEYRYRGVAAEVRRMDKAIADLGLVGYVKDCVRAGRPLPAPFSDPWRWHEIAEDPDSDYAPAAQWLMENVDPWQIGMFTMR
jgi:hypothetical protein